MRFLCHENKCLSGRLQRSSAVGVVVDAAADVVGDVVVAAVADAHVAIGRERGKLVRERKRFHQC